jgi:hypothetical protein
MTDERKQFYLWAATYSINRARELFENHGNPHHAWDAYWWARYANVPIPDWVLTYFDDCANRIRQSKPKAAKEGASAIGLASKGGGPSRLLQADFESERHKAARMVRINRELDPDKRLEDIWAKVAEEIGTSEDHVRDAYYEFRRNS